jgi:hypothetical protein
LPTIDMDVHAQHASRRLALAALTLVLGHTAYSLMLAPAGPGRDADLLAVLAAALPLTVLALRARSTPATWSYVLGGTVGMLYFACTLGVSRMDPTSFSWLMFGDWAQHYLGWEMFRNEGVNLPPGRIAGLWHPVGTSIVFTDSLPLLALPLSFLSPWLPPQFQYIGAFLAASFILQGALAARLAHRAELPAAGQVLVALLFVNAPFLLSRIGHDTLTAHWTLLLCLLLATAASERRAVAMWYAIVALSALIHPYLLAMCGPLAGAAMWWQRRDSPRQVAAHGVGGALLALGLLWLCGAFIIPSQPSLTHTVAYGHFSANLLTFVTPMGRSVLLPEWPMATDGQYEGYAYLGAGVLLLLPAALVALRLPRRVETVRIPGRVWLAAAALALFGVSTVAAIGEIRLIDLPQNGGVFGMFRSSGRFVWPLAYTLMTAAVIVLCARLGPQRSTGVLLAAALLQVWDLSGVQAVVAAHRNAHLEQPWQSPLADPAWDLMAAPRRHLVFMPPPACGVVPADWIGFQQLAARHGLTFNAGFLARHDGQASEAHCYALADQMAQRTLPRDALYVVNPEWKERLLSGLPDQAECITLDGFETCFAPVPSEVEARP